MKRIATALIALALAIGLSSVAHAGATVGPNQMGQLETTIDSGKSLVQKVHGCHRVCRRGPRGVWHRHVGPYCTWRRCVRWRGGPGWVPRGGCWYHPRWGLRCWW